MVRDPQSGKYRRTRLFIIARRKGSLLPFRRVVGLLTSGVLTAKMDKTRNLITAKRRIVIFRRDHFQRCRFL